MLQATVIWSIAGDLPAGWPLLPHSHDFYHLFYLRAGHAVFQVDGIDYPADPGDCILVPPGAVHSMPSDSHSLIELYEVKFTVNEPLLHIDMPMIRSNSYTSQALQYVIYNWPKGTDESRAIANQYMTGFLLALQDGENPTCTELFSYIDSTRYPPLIRKIIRYIEENHTEHFSLTDLAETLQYNKRYLCTAFKEATGVTILDYVNHIRIRHAVSCFYYHDVPIGVVARHVGFVTPIHFSRVFKELVGITPTQFCNCYCLKNIDQRESARLTGQHFSPYEALLGEKLLPLEESIQALKKLGENAKKLL